MTASPEASGVYDHPKYWDLAFADETAEELRFVSELAETLSLKIPPHVYEPGCGGGRLVHAMAERGMQVAACDLSEAAVAHTQQRLRDAGLTAEVAVADMRTYVPGHRLDIAFCPVNTFRHLTTEADAQAHLHAVASAVRAGGLYAIGLHLAPPDIDPDDEETWTASEDDVSVACRLTVGDFERESRLERLLFQIDVDDAGRKFTLRDAFDYRLYTAAELQYTLTDSGQWTIRSVHDFWYDLGDPLELNDELGDTVVVLKRTEVVA